MATNKILGSKNVLKKVFVFLVLSASFLSLNSQDTLQQQVIKKKLQVNLLKT